MPELSGYDFEDECAGRWGREPDADAAARDFHYEQQEKGETHMKFNRAVGLQSSEMTDLQKSFFAPGHDLDGGVELTPMTMRDEVKGEDQQVFVVRGDLREAMLKGLQEGDPIFKANDFALFDRGIVRRRILERMYPSHVFPGDAPTRSEDGTPMVKSGTTDVVKKAYRAHADRPGLSMRELRAAADELDALVREQEGRR